MRNPGPESGVLRVRTLGAEELDEEADGFCCLGDELSLEPADC